VIKLSWKKFKYLIGTQMHFSLLPASLKI
jgi:hypothetical protein